MDPTQKWLLYLYYSLFELKLVGQASLEISFLVNFVLKNGNGVGNFELNKGILIQQSSYLHWIFERTLN